MKEPPLHTISKKAVRRVQAGEWIVYNGYWQQIRAVKVEGQDHETGFTRVLEGGTEVDLGPEELVWHSPYAPKGGGITLPMFD